MTNETNDSIDDEFEEDELYDLEKNCLDEKEWCKREFKSGLKNTYNIKIPNDTNCINDN